MEEYGAAVLAAVGSMMLIGCIGYAFLGSKGVLSIMFGWLVSLYL